MKISFQLHMKKDILNQLVRDVNMAKKVKIAMGQMPVEAGQLDVTLSRACQMIREAANHGADIIVLPESLDLGRTYSGAKDLAEPIPGYSRDKLCQVAKESSIYVVAGLTERSGDRIYNSAIVSSSKGKILIINRKINEPLFALDFYTIGDRLNITETEFGKIGLAICADLRSDGNPIGNTLGWARAFCYHLQLG